MAHLLILDALNLIRRLHAPVVSEQSTTHAQLIATQQRLQRTVMTILDEVQPTHVVAVFDADAPGWRHRLYPQYKQGRSAMPEALTIGMTALQDTLWQCGVDSLLTDEDEADDLIATLSLQLTQRQQPVTLISTDKGFCQLLPRGVAIRDYFNRRWLDHQFVQQHFGVEPRQLVDFWALTGINGSHIPGVNGIGPKGAQTLLQRYGSLDQILSQSAAEDKLLHKVQQHAAAARLAQTLVRLREDIPLGFNLRAIRYAPRPLS